MGKLQSTFSDDEELFIKAMADAMGISVSELIATIVRPEIRRMMKDGELEKWNSFKQANELPED